MYIFKFNFTFFAHQSQTSRDLVVLAFETHSVAIMMWLMN
jgi:hypothetical protein